MTAIPHLLTGAALGARIRNPWVALPLAVASHLLLDAIPHADAKVLAGTVAPGHTEMAMIIAGGSFLVGAALVIWCAWTHSRCGVILLAALAGMLLDLIFVLPWWDQFFKSWPATAWLGNLHLAISNPAQEYPWLLGMTTQVVVSLAALWVLQRSVRAGGAKARRQGLARGTE